MAALLAALLTALSGAAPAQQPARSRPVEINSGRFTFVADPRDEALARSLLSESLKGDTFPGLARPTSRVRIEIAIDGPRFRETIGASAPEWGAAIAVPEENRIVMQGSRASSAAGDPSSTLRHELAHLALHESLGDLPPRWFDEGYASYAAGELARDDVLATNVALVFRGIPSLDSLDQYFTGGESRAQIGYALARRAVAEISALDPARGLSLFFTYWKESSSMNVALRRAYGVSESSFEERWRVGTRRRYGALALFADLSLAMVLFFAVLGPLWVIRRQRDARRLELMRTADAIQERREREDALNALLYGEVPPPITPEAGTNGANENLIN